MHRNSYFRFAMLVCALGVAPLVHAQGQTGGGAGTDNPVPAGNGAGDQPNAAPGPLPAAAAGGGFIRALGGAKPLGAEAGPLSWGWFSIRSAEVEQYYSDTRFNSVAVIPMELSQKVTVFSTALVFEIPAKRYQLAFQYTPTVYYTKGSATYNMNQQFGFATAIKLAPRWGLTLGDQFTYYASQRAFAGLALDVDYQTGGAVQNNFLNGPGSTLVNGADAMITYLWSPRNTIAFGPAFSYQRTQGALAVGQEATGMYEGGKVAWSHVLGPASTITASYTAQRATFNNTVQDAALQGSEILQDTLVDYSRKLGATWLLHLGAGYSGNSAGAGGNTLAAAAGIGKKFLHSEFAVAYYRGHQFNGFITGQSADRLDVIERNYWTKRFSTTSEIDYFRNVGGTSPFFGYYATQQFIYRLSRHFSLTANGSFVRQSGDGIFVIGGRRFIGSGGIRWDAAGADHY
jgi:hypothetical protein